MKTLAIILLVLIGLTSYGQIDRDQLSLDISKAEAANLEKMKAFLWKRVAVVTVDGEKKLTAMADLKFIDDGKLDVNIIDEEVYID